MRRLPPALVLALAGLLAGACRQPTARTGETPTDGPAANVAEVELPEPLPLPSQPDAALWIAEPEKAFNLVAPYSPVSIELRALIEAQLATVVEAELARELTRAFDLRSTAATVLLASGEEIVRVSIDPRHRDSLVARLAELEAVAEFGAVRLPEPASGRSEEWLAWIDEGERGNGGNSGVLVLATSLPALVTARGLEQAYGGQPLFATFDPRAQALPPELAELVRPLLRVRVRGSLDQFVAEVETVPDLDPLAELPLAPGTLAGLLEGPDIAVGASTRYADSAEAVREIIVQVNSEVRRLPFLVRGVAESLAAKLNTALRTWDGRALVAIGPRGHLRVAYGASDVSKSRIAVIRLLQDIVDNVSVARNFVSDLPRLSFRRRVARGDNNEIERFTIQNASRYLPPELRGLLDEGRLHVALGWSHRVGGGLMVAGPNAVDELSRWLDETREAPSGDDTRAQLLAASVAVKPEQLRELMAGAQTGEIPSAATWLELDGGGPQWFIELEALGDGAYRVELRTPGVPKGKRVLRALPRKG